MQNVLLQFDPGYDRLKEKRIVVLGSTGLIASTLIERLCELNKHCDLDLQLVVTYRNKSKVEKRFEKLKNETCIDYLEYDVRNPFPDVDADFIIHSASPAHPKAFVEDPVGVMDANIMGIKNTLEYLRNHKNTRLVYLSSGEVYGDKIEKRPYIESDIGLVDPLNFRSCYPESKRAAETYIRCYAHEFGTDAVIARPGHVYGPALMTESTRVDVQFMNNALNKEDILMKSEGLQRRSYIHVDDVVSGLIVMMLKGDTGEAYNISNKNSDITIRQYAEILGKIANVGVKIDIDKSSCRGSSNVQDSTLDSTKLEGLGWHANISMQEGLESTYHILKSMRRGCFEQ